MTTFAEYLVAASSLSSGTVWELITHPRTGGAGPGVVVNNGATAVINDTALAVALADNRVAVTILDSPVALAIADNRVAVTIAHGVTVQITTQPIGATT